MRLAGPDSAVHETEVNRFGRRSLYGKDQGGCFQVEDRGDAAFLLQNGYIQVTGVPRAGARVCTSCGFRAFFTTCSRCGGTCERE